MNLELIYSLLSLPRARKEPMKSSDNKQAVVNAYASMAAGNPAPYLDLLSDDVSITMYGDHRFARTFKGKSDIYANLFGPIREVLDGTIRMNATPPPPAAPPPPA